MLTSTLTDPTPGSSGTGLNVPFYQQLWLDGKRVNAAPIKLSDLANGTHTVRSWVNDQAGNAAYYTQTFTLSTAADGTRSVSVGTPHVRAGADADRAARGRRRPR